MATQFKLNRIDYPMLKFNIPINEATKVMFEKEKKYVTISFFARRFLVAPGPKPDSLLHNFDNLFATCPSLWKYPPVVT